MAPSKSLVLSAAASKYGNHFDSWNSSSTGHQTAENKLSSSASWRQSCSRKLSNQLKSGAAGGKCIADLVAPGSEHWDTKAKAAIPKDVRVGASVSIADILTPNRHASTLQEKVSGEQAKLTLDTNEKKIVEEPPIAKKGVFDGLTIYVNGSTTPLISDHKLKYLLAEHGAKISIHLGRRQVTHVVLGNPCGRAGSMGAGGGLAAAKIQKEIKRKGGCGIRYVSVQWVLESLKAGIRLQESRFSNLVVASKGQRSVYGGVFKPDSSLSGHVNESVNDV